MLVIRTVILGKEELDVKLRQVPIRAANKLKGAIYLWKGYLSAYIRKELTGRSLQQRTGRLVKVAGDPNSLIVVQTGDSSFIVKYKSLLIPYALTHETGGVITAKSKFLAIPLSQAGQGKQEKPLSEYKKTFLRESKNRKGYTVFENKNGKIVPIFLLRKSIKLPRRQWFTNAARNAAPILARLMKTAPEELPAS